MTQRQQLERLKKLSSKHCLTEKKSEIQSQETIDRKKRWITYFRNNPEIYIEKRMGFHSFGYQNFSYHLMQEANQYIEVSTRGVGKSLRVIVFACFRALLYPNSKVGVTAVGASQANENFITAFMQEIVFQYSGFMKWLYENGLIKTRETDKGYLVTFWNNSTILFCPCIDSTRGIHFDVLIGEELRLIKKADWDSIAMPTLVTRRAGFRNKPKYIDRIDLDEDTKTICITSNRFKNEWFNTMFNNTFVNYFKSKITENRVLCCDIFLALRHGLKKASWFLQQKNEMDDLSFRMEILNETIGEVEGAYFTWEMFKKNQILKKPFYPPTTEDFVNGNIKFRKKKDNELRIVFVDFAFTGGEKSDNTVIGCLSFYQQSDKWVRNVDHIETCSGGEGDNALLKIREIFWDYGADYIVIDQRNGGEIHYDSLTKEFEHPERPDNEWKKNGFTVSNETDLHVVSKSKLDDLRSRTVDKDAIPCIIPITASSEFNSDMWMELNKKLRNEELRFLIDDLEYEQALENDKNYFKMTSEEKARLKIPYMQTTYLIHEAINLTSTWRNGQVSLEKSKSEDRKDRIVALGYGNYIATKIINKYEVNGNNSDINADEWQLVF